MDCIIKIHQINDFLNNLQNDFLNRVGLDELQNIFGKTVNNNNYSHVIDNFFVNYRYKTTLENLQLDALARYLCFKIESKRNNEFILNNGYQYNKYENCSTNLIALLIDEESSTLRQRNIYFCTTYNEDEILEEFNDLKKPRTALKKKQELNDMENYIKSSKIKVIIDYLNTLTNEKINYNIDFDKFLEFLNQNFESISLDKLDEILTILISFVDFFMCLEIKNLSNLQYKKVKTNKNGQHLHVESELALWFRSRKNTNKYIGVSMLCCPFCALFLNSLNFQFRGNHSTFSNSLKNWRMMPHKDTLDQNINKIDNYLQDFFDKLDKIKLKKMNINWKKMNLNNDNIDDDYLNYSRKFNHRSFDISLIKKDSQGSDKLLEKVIQISEKILPIIYSRKLLFKIKYGLGIFEGIKGIDKNFLLQLINSINE